MPPARRVSEALKKRIIRDYTRPGHAVAFSAPGRVAKFYRIPQIKAKKILQEIEGYTLHREYKQPKAYNPYYVHRRRDQVQGDLIDVAGIAEANDRVRFLLALIDIFTKKLWVYPLPNKGAVVMKRTMETWLRSLRTKPKILKTDRGTEFTNRQVQQTLASHRVEWQPANGTMKAAIAERVNKTLQILIYKYLTENETTRYIDVLPRLVQTYNKRGHRTLEGVSPAEADRPISQARIAAIHHSRYDKIAQKYGKEPKYRLGQTVRIKTDPKKITSSARAYAEQFHGEYFNIMRINRSFPIPLYYLRSADTGELIEGGFYAEELQPLSGDLYKIERVLDERVRNGVPEIKVKWKFFGDRWNEWIPRQNVARVF